MFPPLFLASDAASVVTERSHRGAPSPCPRPRREIPVAVIGTSQVRRTFVSFDPSLPPEGGSHENVEEGGRDWNVGRRRLPERGVGSAPSRRQCRQQKVDLIVDLRGIFDRVTDLVAQQIAEPPA
jgi:hypothetical protein